MAARESWHEEMQSAWLYRRLAAAERDARMAALFERLAGTAEQQARRWAALMAAPLPVFAPTVRARVAAALLEHLPPRRLLPVLRALKVRGLSAYDAAPAAVRAAARPPRR